MKRLVILTAITFVMLANVELRAQLEPPCDYPCEGLTWTQHYQQPFPAGLDCPLCTLYVTYDIQTVTCNLITNFNVFVRSIAWSPSCESCYTPGPEMFFAGYNLLLQSVINQFTGDKNIVTFAHIACVAGIVANRDEIVPCPGSDDCCFTTTTWEYINGHYVCTNELLYVPAEECPDECNLLCFGPWISKKSINTSYQLTKPIITPNPAKDLIDVSFESDYSGGVKIEVFDINGEKVIYENREKPTNDFSTPINISGLSPGTYLIYIYINNSQMIWSTKFIVE